MEADYEDLNLNKDDEYIFEYKLLYNCSDKLWIELFEKHNIHNRKSNLEDIMNNSIFIMKKKLNLYLNVMKNLINIYYLNYIKLFVY